MPDDPYARLPARRGLHSVAQIHHLLRVEFGRSQRHRYPLACLVIAVDRLESLRDRHGYEAKEGVLDAVVDLLHRSTRASDYLGRTADDRLLAVVPHTDAHGARILARRLVDGSRSVPRERLPDSFQVTLSVGVAASGLDTIAFHDTLLTAAEAALSDAIAAGGDRFAERVDLTSATPLGRASPAG